LGIDNNIDNPERGYDMMKTQVWPQGFSQKGVQPSYGRPFWKKYKEIHLIAYNFMAKHAFWTASFQCLAKSLFGLIIPSNNRLRFTIKVKTGRNL